MVVCFGSAEIGTQVIKNCKYIHTIFLCIKLALKLNYFKIGYFLQHTIKSVVEHVIWSTFEELSAAIHPANRLAHHVMHLRMEFP